MCNVQIVSSCLKQDVACVFFKCIQELKWHQKILNYFDLICLICARFVSSYGQQIFKEQFKVLEVGIAILIYVYFFDSI